MLGLEMDIPPDCDCEYCQKARDYQETINLEGLDRRLKEDVIKFASKGDTEGTEIVQLARREAQNRMLQLTLEKEAEEESEEVLDV